MSDVTSPAGGVADPVTDAVVGATAGGLTDPVIDAIGATAGGLTDPVTDAIGATAGGVADPVTDAVVGAAGGFTDPVIDAIGATAGGLTERVTDAIGATAGGVTDAVNDAIGGTAGDVAPEPVAGPDPALPPSSAALAEWAVPAGDAAEQIAQPAAQRTLRRESGESRALADWLPIGGVAAPPTELVGVEPHDAQLGQDNALAGRAALDRARTQANPGRTATLAAGVCSRQPTQPNGKNC